MAEHDLEPIYKQLSADMREGLKDIYQQITSVSDKDVQTRASDHALFLEATSQLDEVLKATEEAASNTLGIIEKIENNQEEVSNIIKQLREGGPSEAKLARLESLNKQFSEDLVDLTLQMSFQDLTGQRIKRVVAALNKIEDRVVKLYITSGLIMEGAENDPKKDATELKAEAAKAVEDFANHRTKPSELKGPDKNGISQSAIDDMLAQLGM